VDLQIDTNVLEERTTSIFFAEVVLLLRRLTLICMMLVKVFKTLSFCVFSSEVWYFPVGPVDFCILLGDFRIFYLCSWSSGE
jgi:hypothetical protein